MSRISLPKGGTRASSKEACLMLSTLLLWQAKGVNNQTIFNQNPYGPLVWLLPPLPNAQKNITLFLW